MTNLNNEFSKNVPHYTPHLKLLWNELNTQTLNFDVSYVSFIYDWRKINVTDKNKTSIYCLIQSTCTTNLY